MVDGVVAHTYIMSFLCKIYTLFSVKYRQHPCARYINQMKSGNPLRSISNPLLRMLEWKLQC